MQCVFVIITKLIASKHYFCEEVFCNNFGRDGTHERAPENAVWLLSPGLIQHCDPAGLVQITKTPESRKYEKITKKNTKSPFLGWGPKIRKKYRKNTKMAQITIFVFLRYFFRIFGPQPRKGDFVFFFVIFSYFRDSGVFVICTRPAGSQIQHVLNQPEKSSGPGADGAGSQLHPEHSDGAPKVAFAAEIHSGKRLPPFLGSHSEKADPGVLWKKAPRAMRAMRGKTLETVPFQPYFGCTKSFLKVLST